MSEQKGSGQEFPWDALRGMSEAMAESFMLDHWGCIPPAWNDPSFRDRVTGIPGQAELDAHMNLGEQAYGGRLGSRARGIWYERNIAGQGHPAEQGWLEKNRK
jgi:hypothetical protein